MAVLLALALTLARPPRAYLDTGKAHVPLAISAWCWGARCGAPIARAHRAAHTRRGATVHIHLRFAPTQVALVVGGSRVPATVRGNDVTWRVRNGGGLSLTATGVRGFVTYVSLLSL